MVDDWFVVEDREAEGVRFRISQFVLSWRVTLDPGHDVTLSPAAREEGRLTLPSLSQP